MKENYSESEQFKKLPKKTTNQFSWPEGIDKRLLEFVLANAQKGNPQSCIQTIDRFCQENWMMNLGSVKAEIVIHYLKEKKPLKILEIGSYCGYSSLVLAHHSPVQSEIHCIEVSQQFITIAKKIHQHAGVSKKIHFHLGNTEQNLNFLKDYGAFDFIFIDHVKEYYLSDFKLIEENGGIAKGTVIAGDNILCPGAPNYLDYLKNKVSDKYKSILYHSYVEYSSTPDAVLISERL